MSATRKKPAKAKKKPHLHSTQRRHRRRRLGHRRRHPPPQRSPSRSPPHRSTKKRRPRRKKSTGRGILSPLSRTWKTWRRRHKNRKKRATLRRKRAREARERRERELMEAPSIASTPSSAASIPTFYSPTSTPLSATIPSQSSSSSLLSDKSTPDTLPEFVGPRVQQGGEHVEEKDLQENKQDKEHDSEHDKEHQKKSWFDELFGKGIFGTWFTDPPKDKRGWWSSRGETCRPWLPLQCPGGDKCVGTGLGIRNFHFKGKCMPQ